MTRMFDCKGDFKRTHLTKFHELIEISALKSFATSSGGMLLVFFL